jgi:nucleoid-associated protein EbfC
MSINPLNFLSQLNTLKDQAKSMEAKLTTLRIQGSAANLVTVTINGKLDLIDIKIDPLAVDPRDTPMLETLIKSAFHDANQKAKAIIASEFSSGDLASIASLLKP